MKRASKTGAILATVTLLAIWGCSGDAGTPQVSSSSEEAAVKGTVSVDGKLASGGMIKFDPANINRRTAMARTAEIGKDGSYSVTTLIGENSVSLQGRGLPQMYKETVTVKSGGDTIAINAKTK